MDREVRAASRDRTRSRSFALVRRSLAGGANTQSATRHSYNVRAARPSCAGLTPEIASAVLAVTLHRIHAVPVAGCPFVAEWSLRVREAEARSQAGFIDESDFDGENHGRSPESLLAELRSFPPLPEWRCFAHGDATLENFLELSPLLPTVLRWRECVYQDQ